MKQQILFSIKSFILFFVFFMLFLGCDNSPIVYYQGVADIEVTNLTTGESHKNNSTITILLDGTSYEVPEFVFRHGDVMQMKFTPPKEYKNTQFSVDFSVLDRHVVLNESPYTSELTIPDDVPVGTYKVACTAKGSNWETSISQSLSFRVE